MLAGEAGESAFVSLIVPSEGLLCGRALGLSYEIGTQSRRRLEVSVVSKAGLSAVGFDELCLGGLKALRKKRISLSLSLSLSHMCTWDKFRIVSLSLYPPWHWWAPVLPLRGNSSTLMFCTHTFIPVFIAFEVFIVHRG